MRYTILKQKGKQTSTPLCLVNILLSTCTYVLYNKVIVLRLYLIEIIQKPIKLLAEHAVSVNDKFTVFIQMGGFILINILEINNNTTFNFFSSQ